MATGMRKTRPGSARTHSRKPYWLVAGAACAAIALTGLVIAFLPSSSHGDDAQANLCQKFDVDPNTGKMRDRGRVPCDQMRAQKNRVELIRESFKQH